MPSIYFWESNTNVLLLSKTDPFKASHFIWTQGWSIARGNMPFYVVTWMAHFIWSHGWPIVRGNMSFYLVTWVAHCQREHVILFGYMDGPFYLVTWMAHFIWSHGWPILCGQMDDPFSEGTLDIVYLLKLFCNVCCIKSKVCR